MNQEIDAYYLEICNKLKAEVTERPELIEVGPGTLMFHQEYFYYWILISHA